MYFFTIERRCFMCYEYDSNYPDTTTTINNEGNPGVNDPENYGMMNTIMVKTKVNLMIINQFDSEAVVPFETRVRTKF